MSKKRNNYRLYIKHEKLESEKIIKFSEAGHEEAKAIREIVVESFKAIGVVSEVTLLWETYGLYSPGPMSRFENLAKLSERPLETFEDIKEGILTVYNYQNVK